MGTIYNMVNFISSFLYRLNNWSRPQNKYELFNLRHAQARNIIERIFGVLKNRFQILRLACQGFTGHTPVRVRNGSLPEGLNEYPAQLPRLGQLRTHVGSKSLVMQDCKRLPRLITAPEYFGNLQREMSQVATQTFNVLYCFPFIWFNGSHYPRSYI